MKNKNKFDLKFEQIIKKFKNNENDLTKNRHNFLKSVYEKQDGVEYIEKLDFSFLKDAIPIYANEKLKNDKLVFEEVYRSNIFIGLIKQFKKIKTLVKFYQCVKIFELMPLFFKQNENFNSLIKDKKNVFIFKFGFSKADSYKNLINSFYEVSKQESFNEIDLNMINQFYQSKIKNQNSIGGYYCPIKGVNFSIMILNKDIDDSNTIKHEMIHYFQDVTGQSIVDYQDKQFETFNLIPKEKIKLIFNSYQIIPYFNTFCYVLEDNSVKTLDQAMNVYDKFIEKYFNDPETYINYCKNLKQYKWFKKRPATIHMIMLCKIHNQLLDILKDHVEKYFE